MPWIMVWKMKPSMIAVVRRAGTGRPEMPPGIGVASMKIFSSMPVTPMNPTRSASVMVRRCVRKRWPTERSCQ